MLGDDLTPAAPARPKTPGLGRVQAMAASSPSKSPSQRYESYVGQPTQAVSHAPKQYSSPSRSSRDYAGSPAGEEDGGYREGRLAKVFAAFDLNHDGAISNEATSSVSL